MPFQAAELSRIDISHARLSWTGTPGATVRVFRDGVLFAGPYDDADAGKSADVGWDTDEPVSYEVHEENTDGSFCSQVEQPEILPELFWYDRDDFMWRAYWQEVGGADEAILMEGVPDHTEQIQRRRVPAELNGVADLGVWHKFRIEALDSNLMESQRAQWAALIRDQQTGPSDIQVTAEGGGLFTITLTE